MKSQRWRERNEKGNSKEDRSNSEVVAEIGLCITWRIELEPAGSERISPWLDEAMDLYALSSEIKDGGAIQGKLATKIQKLSADQSEVD